MHFLESPNDQLLWSPPLDTNQEENSALVNKYLKLAAKECMLIPTKQFFKFYFRLDRTADQEVVLEIFLSTNYNIDQALDKLRLPTTNKNYCKFHSQTKKKTEFHFSEIFSFISNLDIDRM